jgi:hypothetical protein
MTPWLGGFSIVAVIILLVLGFMLWSVIAAVWEYLDDPEERLYWNLFWIGVVLFALYLSSLL